MTLASPAGTREWSTVAVIGCGPMGRGLALRLEEFTHSVTVYDTKPSLSASLALEAKGRVQAAESLEALLCRPGPRLFFLLLPAGQAVDDTLSALCPTLTDQDLVLELGNSHYKDTVRRIQTLQARGVTMLGIGISGGPAGARGGSCLMVGGSRAGYDKVCPLLERLAARTSHGASVAHFGLGGAGHFVKMVHNGIEYAEMQLLAEAYHLLRDGSGLSYSEIADVFSTWQSTALSSYLLELTKGVLTRKAPGQDCYLLDSMEPRATHNGTGLWMVQSALELHVPHSVIASALEARVMSCHATSPLPRAPAEPTLSPLGLTALSDALQSARVCAYAQGFSLLFAASRLNGWPFEPGKVLKLWQGGSILRSRLLSELAEVYEREPERAELLEDESWAQTIRPLERGWRQTVQVAVDRGIPVPVLGSALAYYDSLHCRLPQHLVQAQRNAFGQHPLKIEEGLESRLERSSR